ncbi:MAG: toxin-antitoxin system [Acidobacteria bacterium]|nr:toxin-antitoxin system [Acidobacteriota bacterium]
MRKPAQLVVRNLEAEVKSRLQRRAAQNGWSMEEEVRVILRNVVNAEERPLGLGTDIASLFMKVGLDSEIPELRGQTLQAASFEE